MRRLLEWLAGEGMHGLVVAGTTGEWFSMSSEEKAVLFATVGEVLKGELPLIAGCNAFTADTALANELRARGIERAREFSWTRSISRTRELYQRVAG